MTSRLSSLLVRDGLVRVQRMEHVFQRQVIHGGALDTILLEMGLVEAPRLQQYLSLASGLPPANSHLQEPSAELLKVCTKEIASKHHVAPVRLDNNTLEVLVCDPVDVATLESLADLLDLSVQPMVVPEYQYQVALAQAYGQEAEERFALLAAKHVTNGSNGVATKHVPTVTFGERAHHEEDVDEDDIDKVDGKIAGGGEDRGSDSASVEDRGNVPLAIAPEATQPADTSERVRGKRPPAEQPARRMTMELNTDSLREHVQATMAMAADAPKIIASQEGVAEDTEVSAQAPEPEAATAPAEPSHPDTSKTVEMTAAEMPVMDTAPVASPSASQVAEGSDEPVSPYPAITPDEARALLDASEDRDEIFIILMRAMRKHARFTSLFMIKGQSATGRLALSKPGLDQEEIRTITIDLGPESRFQKVIASKAFSIGPMDVSDAGVKSALAQLGGGEVPASALLLPIVVRDRVIAIAVAHNRDKGIKVGRVTELLPLGTATADAVNRLIAKMRAEASAQSGPVASPNPASNRADSMTDSASLPVASEAMLELFARIESDDEEVSKAACLEAVGKSEQVIEHLAFCFPGRLFRTREDSNERLKAAEHGPVLDVIIRIGPSCGTALAEKMRDANREVRYYATLCAAELRPEQVLNELVERLFDTDEKIRVLAVEALAGYPKADLSSALDFARRALHSEDNGRVKVAADGLTKLGDVTAIPDLIDAHSRGGDAAEVSRSALFQLTTQDFGNSTRKWRGWWEKNKSRSRIDWMLEGLDHKNAEVRKQAVETLRSLTGEYFGFGHDLPKKEREKTRQLWVDWWNKADKKRYS